MAHKALLVVRDDKKLLPLSKDKKILVIEQLIPYPVPRERIFTAIPTCSANKCPSTPST